MPRAGFGPKRRIIKHNTCIFTVFVDFYKMSQSLRSQLSKSWVADFLETRAPKRGFSTAFLRCFLAFEEKRLGCKTPLFPGGGDVRPKRTKKGQQSAFLLCFLVLHKSEKVASQPHLKRPSCELFGAPGPKEKRKTCMFTMFSCSQEEKTCMFTCF